MRQYRQGLTALVVMTGVVAGGAFIPAHAAEEALSIDVRKTATCGCCAAWIDKLEAAGHKTHAQNMPFSVLAKYKTKNGIPPKLASCHTAKVGGYVIEGHVPAREIARLLKEKPDAIGLTVPGMPIGSPGMESGNHRDAYDVLLILKDGSTRVFAHYPQKG